MRVDGKPILLLYRPVLLPDPKGTAERWRAWCRENGIGEMELVHVQSFERPVPRDIGFDAAVEFPPSLKSPVELTSSQRLLNPAYQGSVLQWATLARALPASESYRRYRGVNCGWTTRRGDQAPGLHGFGATPGAYSRCLRQVVDQGSAPIFVNAWNEWAEGAALEPNARQGYAFLAATRNALQPPPPPHKAVCPCVVVHAWYPSVFEEMLDRLASSTRDPIRLVVTTSAEQRAGLARVLDEARRDRTQGFCVVRGVSSSRRQTAPSPMYWIRLSVLAPAAGNPVRKRFRGKSWAVRRHARTRSGTARHSFGARPRLRRRIDRYGGHCKSPTLTRLEVGASVCSADNCVSP